MNCLKVLPCRVSRIICPQNYEMNQRRIEKRKTATCGTLMLQINRLHWVLNGVNSEIRRSQTLNILRSPKRPWRTTKHRRQVHASLDIQAKTLSVLSLVASFLVEGDEAQSVDHETWLE